MLLYRLLLEYEVDTWAWVVGLRRHFTRVLLLRTSTTYILSLCHLFRHLPRY